MVEAGELESCCDLGRCVHDRGPGEFARGGLMQVGLHLKFTLGACSLGMKATWRIVTKARRALELRVQVFPWASWAWVDGSALSVYSAAAVSETAYQPPSAKHAGLSVRPSGPDVRCIPALLGCAADGPWLDRHDLR